VVGDEEVTTATEKAEVFIDTLFLAPPRSKEVTQTRKLAGKNPEWPELTMHEVEAIFESNQDNAPGPDEIWQVIKPYFQLLCVNI
jgi:hypothetical protein